MAAVWLEIRPIRHRKIRRMMGELFTDIGPTPRQRCGEAGR